MAEGGGEGREQGERRQNESTSSFFMMLRGDCPLTHCPHTRREAELMMGCMRSPSHHRG
jgi:hypothetical protein